MLDPFVQFALDFFDVEESVLVDFIVFLVVVVVNHSAFLLHLEFVLEVVVHEILHFSFVHAFLSELHFELGFSPGHVVFFDGLLVDSFVFVPVEFLNIINITSMGW